MEEMISRYGSALYSLAYEKNLIEEYQSQIKEAIIAINDNPSFLDVLSSGFLPLEKKNEIIDRVFSNFTDEIKSFIKIIVKNNRGKYLVDIFYSYNSLANEYRHVDEGIIYSTEKIDKERVEEITQKLSKIEKCQIELRNVIDPSLIGGVKVVIHDHVYDGSIKNRLEKLRENLLKKEGDSYEN